MNALELLSTGLQRLKIKHNAIQLESLLKYITRLQEWNSAYNLTAINDTKDIILYHIFDCLSCLPYIDGHRILDVGSGAGLPTIPLAILKPNIEFVAIDANSKKIRFIKHISISQSLYNVKAISCRVESYNDNNFDMVISRAFTDASTFIGLTRKNIVDNGQFLLLKGKLSTTEREANSLTLNYCVHTVNIPYLDAERTLLVINNQGVSEKWHAL